MAPPKQDVRQRFFKHTQRTKNGCLEWTGKRNSQGYGQFRVGDKTPRAHRVAWELEHGPIPQGMAVCHRCDNPSCVDVNHLFLGDALANQRDRIAKGRGTDGEKNGRSILTVHQVIEARDRYTGRNAAVLAREYGVSASAMRYALTGKTWTGVRKQ